MEYVQLPEGDSVVLLYFCLYFGFGIWKSFVWQRPCTIIWQVTTPVLFKLIPAVMHLGVLMHWFPCRKHTSGWGFHFTLYKWICVSLGEENWFIPVLYLCHSAAFIYLYLVCRRKMLWWRLTIGCCDQIATDNLMLLTSVVIMNDQLILLFGSLLAYSHHIWCHQLNMNCV